MWNYIIRRLLQTLVVLFLLSFASYALMSLMPGDPLQEMIAANPRITQADIERLRALYGLDLPMHERYFNWLRATLSGDFGYSRTYKVPVMDLMGERLLNTFILSFAAILVALVIALPVGIISALKNGTRLDYILNLFTFAGNSLPAFWLGIMAIMIFAVGLQWFPAGGTETIGSSLTGMDALFDRGRYLVLPVAVFTVAQMASYVRFTRGSVIDVLKQDYIRTAKAKGLKRGRVIIVHALRNALIPLVTLLALSLAGVFNGAIITEQVFAYRGVGKLVYESIISNDFNVAMVSFNITIAMVLVMNLIADVAYAFLDPRISYQ